MNVKLSLCWTMGVPFCNHTSICSFLPKKNYSKLLSFDLPILHQWILYIHMVNIYVTRYLYHVLKLEDDIVELLPMSLDKKMLSSTVSVLLRRGMWTQQKIGRSGEIIHMEINTWHWWYIEQETSIFFQYDFGISWLLWVVLGWFSTVCND